MTTAQKIEVKTKSPTSVNTFIQFIHVRNLDKIEGENLFKDILSGSTKGFLGEQVRVQKRMRVIGTPPQKCACCGIEVDSYSVGWSRTDFYSQNNEGLVLIPCASGRIMNVDHIIPLSVGGVDGATNMRYTCVDCNCVKAHHISDKELSEVSTKWLAVVRPNVLIASYRGRIKSVQKLKNRMKTDKKVTQRMLEVEVEALDTIRRIVTAMFKDGVKLSEACSAATLAQRIKK